MVPSRTKVIGCLAVVNGLLWLFADHPARASSINDYQQTNLVSDLSGVAANTDPNLVNPWGIAFSPTSPIWISDNGSGVSTIYNGSGGTVIPAVTIPPPHGGSPPATPTGIVSNGTPGFGGAHFIFATEDGTISSWSGGASAVLGPDNSASGAVYKGLALVGDTLFATNFNSGKIDVFDSSFAPVTTPGGFVDPTLPAGFAPFGIENIGGLLYVTYAEQDAAKHDDVAGPGNGFVDVFNTDGVLQQRLISNGPLNSPWGLAVAPSNFGAFGGDLLVGNFGDGLINAFTPGGTFVGTLDDAKGNPIDNLGLWGLAFGNGAFGTSTSTLYFTAGIPGPGGMVEDNGLFGSLRVVPEPSSLLLLGTALAAALGVARKHSKKLIS